ETLSEFIDTEKNRAFKIDRPGLFSLFVLITQADSFIFVFSFHHAITDGWSVASLMSEFTKAYVDKKTIAMETIPPYQHVIQQERNAIASSEHDAFWRDYLSNAP